MPVAINSVTLSGNLVKDPEKKLIGSVETCLMRLASSKTFTKRDGTPGDETVYIDVEARGRLAAVCASYLRKGSGVVVNGRLAGDVEDAKGRVALFLKADTVIFTGANPNSIPSA